MLMVQPHDGGGRGGGEDKTAGRVVGGKGFGMRRVQEVPPSLL